MVDCWRSAPGSRIGHDNGCTTSSFSQSVVQTLSSSGIRVRRLGTHSRRLMKEPIVFVLPVGLQDDRRR